MASSLPSAPIKFAEHEVSGDVSMWSRLPTGRWAGKTVNIKTCGDVLGGIDIGTHPCDCYLVLTGPPRTGSAGVRHHRWRTTGVYLFETATLLAVLGERGVKIGIATSLRKADAEAAQVFPRRSESPLQLSADQIALLQLFTGAGTPAS
jgi:hypothetical protein